MIPHPASGFQSHQVKTTAWSSKTGDIPSNTRQGLRVTQQFFFSLCCQGWAENSSGVLWRRAPGRARRGQVRRRLKCWLLKGSCTIQHVTTFPLAFGRETSLAGCCRWREAETTLWSWRQPTPRPGRLPGICCRAGNEAEEGYKTCGPHGGPVLALVHVWELKKGSGGEEKFNPGLSNDPAHMAGGRPWPLRRVTGGSSRRGGIPPSSSRPADESPCRRAASLRALLSHSCAPAPWQMCAATHHGRDGGRRRMTPQEGLGGQRGGTPGHWSLLTSLFTQAQEGRRCGAIATWLPCERKWSLHAPRSTCC